MKYKINKIELESIVKNCLSIADVCRALNIKPIGGNYKTVKSKILLWNINISHFTGKGWNVGKRFSSFSHVIPLSEILIEHSTYTNGNCLRKRLISKGLKEHKCENCGLKTWMDDVIPIELHHVNGNNMDNRIDNLKILCPNCHTQTSTFRGRNIKAKIKQKK